MDEEIALYTKIALACGALELDFVRNGLAAPGTEHRDFPILQAYHHRLLHLFEVRHGEDVMV